MPYRNLVTSQIWNRMMMRRRQIVDPPIRATEPELPGIWTPLPTEDGQDKSRPAPDLPAHSWRSFTGVSNR